MWAPNLRSRLLSRCGGIGKLRFSHTAAADRGPTETLRKRLADLAKNRRKKDPRKNKLFVETPRSLKWLDTPTVGMYLVCVGTDLFVKILMMIHVMSLDFCLLSTFAPFWIYNDMTARRWFDKGSWLLPVSLVPLIGPSLYLILRPPLSELPESSERA